MDNKEQEVAVIQQENDDPGRKFAIALVITVLITASFILFFWLGSNNAKLDTYNREMQEYYESKVQEVGGQNTVLDIYKAE